MSDEHLRTETPEDVVEAVLDELVAWMDERNDGSVRFRDAVERKRAEWRGRFGNALARERNARAKP